MVSDFDTCLLILEL